MRATNAPLIPKKTQIGMMAYNSKQKGHPKGCPFLIEQGIGNKYCTFAFCML